MAALGSWYNPHGIKGHSEYFLNRKLKKLEGWPRHSASAGTNNTPFSHTFYLSYTKDTCEKGKFWLTTFPMPINVFKKSKYFNNVAHKLFILRWYRQRIFGDLEVICNILITLTWNQLITKCYKYYLLNISCVYPLFLHVLSLSSPRCHSPSRGRRQLLSQSLHTFTAAHPAFDNTSLLCYLLPKILP